MTLKTTGTLTKHLTTIRLIWLGKDPRSERIVFLERFVLLLLCIAMFATPAFWIRHIGGLHKRTTRKVLVELYAVAKVALAAILLFGHLWTVPYISIVVIWLLADLFINLAGRIFLRNFWQNPYSWNRSLMLLFINFAEYTTWFACLFLSWGLLRGHHDVLITASSDALYFSIVTAATVGYGDITPAAGLGRWMVMLEIFASLFFIATVVAYFVSNMSNTESDKSTELNRPSAAEQIVEPELGSRVP